MAEPMVRSYTEGAVEYVVIDRPERRNALTYAGWAQLKDALLAAAVSPSRVVVVGGVDGHFCSGGDLSGSERDEHPYRQIDGVAQTCNALVELPKPTIARVDGLAIGAGFGVALSCDFVVSSDRARYGTMFVARGLSMDFGISWLLPRLVGLRTAKRLCLLPELFDAAAADELGLLDAVVPAESLSERTDALAAELAAGAPIALRLAKQLLNRSLSRGLDESLAAEAAAQAVNLLSADSVEGRTAFVERRPPRFQGF